ncbi:MAG: hypothetical protein LBG11_02180 [Bifidobacteriaceae bacterium]|nr:hypothetical protein [Bifidobacteriaceae bacterium]
MPALDRETSRDLVWVTAELDRRWAKVFRLATRRITRMRPAAPLVGRSVVMVAVVT